MSFNLAMIMSALREKFYEKCVVMESWDVGRRHRCSIGNDLARHRHLKQFNSSHIRESNTDTHCSMFTFKESEGAVLLFL